MTQLGKRSLIITVDGTDMTVDATNIRITSKAAASGTTTFANAKAGGTREYHLEGTAVQNIDTSTLWDKVWAHTGATAVIVLWPNGQATGGGADATHPSFTGTVTIQEADGDLLGGDASTDQYDLMVFTLDWTYLAKPVKATS